MPSSPNFTDFTRLPERFFYRGIQLLPQDALTEGKLAWALNIRSYQEGTITIREGWSEVSDGPLDVVSIHSLFRLNDTTPYATVDARRFAGVDTNLFAAAVAAPGTAVTFSSAVNGFSGNPLTGVVSTPWDSPRPYLYIGDSAQLRKINTDLDDYPVGIASPEDEPEATYAAVQTTYLNTIGGASPSLWSSYGVATPASPTPLPISDRINTTVSEILYDLGTNPSMASIALTDMEAVIPGIDIVLGASNEEVIVEEVHPAIAPTTIAAIIYDVGSTGLCTIQPTGSFTMGQVEAAVPADVQARYTAEGVAPPRVTVSRTVDYPVDSLIEINATEVVRILSVSLGPDGTMSFRCTTAGTYAAGNSLTGIASFRAFVNTAVAAASAAVADCVTNTITCGDAEVAEVGGIQSPMSGGSRNWGLVGNRASQPDDYIRFGIRVSSLSYVQSVRLLLNVSDDDGGGGSDFLHNYYFYEWRQNDLIAAIQVTAGTPTALVSTEQAGAVQQGQVDAYYQDQYGYNTTVEGGVVRRGPRGIMPGPAAPPKGPKGTISDEDRAAMLERQARARAQQADNNVSVGSAISRQLAVGNDQWIVLQCRLGDLSRVGTEQTLTLNAILGAAVTVQALGTTDPITISYSDCYMTGGYGPDVSMTWNPYVYRYRYRSTITGARSNPSPPMRAGIKPHRGRVVLFPFVSDDPQVDVIDWYRFGGALARWAYVGTSDNGGSPEQYTDDFADEQIESGATLSFDHYQPWPITDLPRTVVCNVAGNAVSRVSGDLFDTRWAEGSAIIVDGRATALYKQPDSTSLLFVKDSCGDGTSVTVTLPGATILSQPLASVWGGPLENTVYHFACGDPSDPGVLHWSAGNDPDSTSDRYTLYVTDASDPLVNGFFYDGQPYVFSSTRLFRIIATGDPDSAFRVIETACTRGLWSAWAFCVTPYGTVFLSGDGVYLTESGSEAQPLSDPDLRPLFPQDGSAPQTVRNLDPIDFTVTGSLKLTYVDQLVYFDYVTTAGDLRTLVYDPRVKGWTPDQYDLAGVTARLSESATTGPEVHSALVGCDDSNVYLMDATKTTDVLTDIQWAVWTRWPNAGDPRSFKQWGDAILDMNPGGSVNGIEVTPVIDYGNTALVSTTLGALDTVRYPYIVEIGEDSPSWGDGVWSRNLGLWIEGAVQACDEQRPLLYLWEPSFAQKQITVARRATDWSDLGYMGAKFVQGVVIRANTFGVPKTVYVQYDDAVNDSPAAIITLVINHDGEETKAYPLSTSGWDPFIAQLVRLQGADDVDWALLEWRFVWEPAPELATQWETQYTTHDFPGFLHVFDGVVAYLATTTVELVVEYENGQSGTYTLPSTAGEYNRIRVIFESDKGRAVRYRWTSDEPFRLFKQDCSVRVQGWGVPGGYQVVSPFGGPSRVDGAGI